jgi:hypothetical protein
MRVDATAQLPVTALFSRCAGEPGFRSLPRRWFVSVDVVVCHRFIVVGGGLAGLSSRLLAPSGNLDFMVACNSATGVGRRPLCLWIYRTSAASQSNWQN